MILTQNQTEHPMTDQEKITEQLRSLVNESTASQYRIAKDSGVPQPTVHAFAGGRAVSGETVDRLAMYFGVRLTKPRGVKQDSA